MDQSTWIPSATGLRGYDHALISDACMSPVGDERTTLVQQHLKDEADINTIVRRFGITGSMPFGPNAGVYGDFTGITDFDDAVALVEQTRRQFMSLPPEVRERFKNNPAEMVRFAQGVTEEEFLSSFVKKQEEVPPTAV